MSVEDRLAELEGRVRQGEIGEFTPYAASLVERFEAQEATIRSHETRIGSLEATRSTKESSTLDRKWKVGIALAAIVPVLNFLERNFNIVGK